MTGRDLIIYILQHDLLYKRIDANDKFLDFLTVDELAAKFEVGPGTIKAWTCLYLLEYLKFGNSMFFPPDVKDPRKE